MAGHGVTLPQCVAIARHAGSPCPRSPLIPVSIPHLAPSERSLVSSQKYYVHSTMFAANKQQAPPGNPGSGAVG